MKTMHGLGSEARMYWITMQAIRVKLVAGDDDLYEELDELDVISKMTDSELLRSRCLSAIESKRAAAA